MSSSAESSPESVMSPSALRATLATMICASGAMPTISPALPAVMPATCVPCDPACPVGEASGSLSA